MERLSNPQMRRRPPDRWYFAGNTVPTGQSVLCHGELVDVYRRGSTVLCGRCGERLPAGMGEAK